MTNRLLEDVKTETGKTTRTTYYCDPNGNQIAKAVDTYSSAAGEPLVTISDVLDCGKLSRYNGFNQLVETRVNGVEVSYDYAPSGLRLSKTVDDTTTSFVLDNGYVALELQDGNPFRYCAEYFDTETGRIYLRARYYDPVVGRLISPDPYWTAMNLIYGDYLTRFDNCTIIPDILAIKQSGNRYVYCCGNPVNFADPTGLPTFLSLPNGRVNPCLVKRQGFTAVAKKRTTGYAHGIKRLSL